MAYATWDDLEDGKAAPAGHACKTEQAVLDLAHLRRFTLGDRMLEDEVLGLFEAQAVETVATLARTMAVRDWTMATHTIKGSARAVGAFEVAALAERLEKSGPGSVSTEGLIGELAAALARARRAIAANRQANGSPAAV